MGAGMASSPFFLPRREATRVCNVQAITIRLRSPQRLKGLGVAGGDAGMDVAGGCGAVALRAVAPPAGFLRCSLHRGRVSTPFRYPEPKV